MDFQKKRFTFIMSLKIQLCVFMERKEEIVFIDSNNGVFILKSYEKLIKISDYMSAYQIIRSSCMNYFVLKSKKCKFVLFKTYNNEIESGNRLRMLRKGSLKYSKKSIILSCLNYSIYLNH